VSPSDRERAQARLDALRAGFAARLRERLAELEALVQRAHGGDAGALRPALAAAHRLAGTAGSYGYPDVGDAAAALERALQRVDAEPREARAWDDARAALARAHASAPPVG
jgi:HPt (histidine-containing phosphotransfer) domain-containing protein